MAEEHKGEKIEIDLEKRREALKEIMESREKEVEYGYFKGCLSDVSSLLTNPHIEENPLQSPLRLCKLWGSLRFALSTRGTIPIVHGPIGCTHIIGKAMTALSSSGNWAAPLWPCVCTDMGEKEIIYGGEEKLRRAILAVDRDYKPDLIAVLTTCPVSIIGDDVKAVVDSVRDKIRTRIIWVDSAGFSYRNQGSGYDDYLLAIVDQLMEEPKQKIPNSINWVGEWGFPLQPPQMSDMQEMGRVLNKIGITIHCSLVGGEEVSRLIKAPEAEVNTMRCTGNALNAMRRMEEKFGMPYVATGIPQGIQPTIDFIMATAEKLDLVKKAEEVVDEEVKQTLKEIEPYKKVLEGKKIAISAATARVIALAKFAMEMGMEPVFLGFHYIREKTFANIKDFLKTTGLNPEAICEPSVYEEEAIMKRLKPDLWLIDPTEQTAGLSQGVPTFMDMAYMPPFLGFQGAVNMARLFAGGMINPLTHKYGLRMYEEPFSSEQYLKDSPIANRPLGRCR